MIQESLTPLEEKRQEFAERLVALIYELDELLVDEYNEVKATQPEITPERLEELLLRKFHVGGIPYALKIKSNGLIEPNAVWVSKGYFKMNLSRPMSNSAVLSKIHKHNLDGAGNNKQQKAQ